MVNKGCPAMQVSLSGEKVTSSNSSVPDTGSFSNINFLYNVYFSYKKVISTVFRASPMSTVS